MRSRPPPAWLLALGLVLAVFALYWPVHAHGFVSYDDEVYLTQNPHVAKGLDGAALRFLWTHEHAANFHPLTWMAHMLDVELFGLERPGLHHLVNVALHALNAVLVLFLGRALLGNLLAAALAAALFALHPLRVESVAWASERKDVLCAAFFLSAALLYLGYARTPSLRRYLLVCCSLFLALTAKPMAVTWPCVALLLDVAPLARLDPARPLRACAGRSTARLLLEKAPFFALAALGAASTWFAQRVGGSMSGTLAVPLELRLWNALASYGVYLRETFWPADLAVFHPLAATVSEEPRRALLAPALFALLVLAATSALAWRERVRRPWFGVAWLWFLGTLVPVIGLKQVGSQAHADRYTYLPLLGIAWIVAGFAGELATARARLRGPLAAAAIASLLALAFAARAQLATWKDTESLFTRALEVNEKAYIAHSALGALYADRGELERARKHLARALEIYPLDALALTSLGRLALDEGDLESADRYLKRAKQVHASKWVRYHLGRLKLRQQNPEAAAREFGAALALDPSLVDAHFNLGQVRFGLGEKEAARTSFEAARALDPAHAGAWNGLGVLALEAGELSEAEACFTRAVTLDPKYADAVNNLGVVLERQGRVEEARQRYAEARALYGGAR